MTDKERGEIIEQLRELQDQADEWLQSEPRALGREFHRGQVDGFRQAILVVQAADKPA